MRPITTVCRSNGRVARSKFPCFGSIPAGLPPIFMARAQDDNVVVPIAKFHDALTAAGAKPEMHIYSGGGHGFGMQKHGTTSDRAVLLVARGARIE